MQSKTTEVFQKLSVDVKPQNYQLTVCPNLETFLFEACDYIELHSAGLNLNNIQFTPDDTKEVYKAKRLETIVEKDTVQIHFTNEINAGSGKLSIEFSGQLNENLNAFYRTRCMNRNGQRGYAAVTQFEATYAREAFPCFDEPELKATFDIIIQAERSKTVLSNMPLKEVCEFPDSELLKFHFERTPIMSTYLVAYIVGEYDCIHQKDDNGVLVSVWTPIGKTEMGRFSLDITVKALPFYAKYFDLEYPLPKLDLIGLEDVEIEAMENWGLLTFKESLILIDPDNFTIQSKAEVALVVSHEIAHQWFGNIVTMEWWTHLWLNEGFATWIEYLSVDFCLPEWNIWNYYAVDHLLRAFELDSLANSHPIEVEVGNPDEINQIFDSISYCKGSGIIRMLNDYIGNTSFIKGLQSYLKKYQYKNATTDNLWTELSISSEMDIGALMNTWTKNSGYPLITVDKKVDSENNTILKMSQKKFYKISKADEENVVWKIPVTVITQSTYPKVHSKFLMDCATFRINCGVIPGDDWIMLNADYTGFYRTEYSEAMLKPLFVTLENNPAELGSSLDRIGFINDLFALCWSNTLSVSKLLEFVWLFRNETDTYVWLMLLKQIQQLARCLVSTEFNENFQLFFKALLSNISKKLGYELKSNASDQELLLHEKVLYSLARVDDCGFKIYAKSLYDGISENPIPANMQKAVYTSVLRNANESLILDFIEMYKKCYTPEEKERIIVLLSEVINEDLIKIVLDFSISEVTTKEETVYLLIAFAENSTCKMSMDLVWCFVKNKWKTIDERYSNSVLMGRLLKPLLQNFSTKKDLQESEEFVEENKTPSAEGPVQQGIEILRSKIDWLSSQKDGLSGYFSSNSNSNE